VFALRPWLSASPPPLRRDRPRRGDRLVAINQGDALVAGRWQTSLAWTVPLTYLVPFLVATWGALVNSRVR